MEKDEEKTDDYPDYYGCVIMIVDERIVTFINSMETENSRILENIEREALDARVPYHSERDAELLKGALTCEETYARSGSRKLPEVSLRY